MSRQLAERIADFIWRQLKTYSLTKYYTRIHNIACLQVENWEELFSEDSDEDQRVYISMDRGQGKPLSGIYIYYSGRVYFVLAPSECQDDVTVSEDDTEMKELSKNLDTYVKFLFPSVAIRDIVNRYQNPRYRCETAWPRPANGKIEVRIHPNVKTYGMKIYDIIYGVIENGHEDTDNTYSDDDRYIWTHIDIRDLEEFLEYINNKISSYNPISTSELSNLELIQEIESIISLASVFEAALPVLQELRKRLV